MIIILIKYAYYSPVLDNIFVCHIVCRYNDTSASAHSLMLVYDHLMYTALEDLANDGDHKLLVGDLGSGQYDMKLKVFKGKNLMYFCTHTLTYHT